MAAMGLLPVLTCPDMFCKGAAYFRPRDEGRGFIILSLAEAEH